VGLSSIVERNDTICHAHIKLNNAESMLWNKASYSVCRKEDEQEKRLAFTTTRRDKRLSTLNLTDQTESHHTRANVFTD